MQAKEIVVSGIRPTGNLHLGNYFGAVKQFLQMQKEFDCYFFVADYHSLTTHPNPTDMRQNVRQILMEYLAAGLDPELCTLYIQSELPETAELYLLLSMHAYVGELQKCTSFKDKIRKQPNNINAGLLTYPILMAADILIHRAAKVPVGEDQRQHLEMARDYARRFNKCYDLELFPEPEAFNFSGKLVKVPGLDGSGKMGKSEGPNNAIYLLDDEATILKKMKKAKTDSGPTEPNAEKPAEIKNLFTLAEIVNAEMAAKFEEDYNNMTIRYGDFKKALAAEMTSFVAPFQKRYQEIEADTEYVDKVAALGREKAQESARKTLNTAREAIGLKNIY